MKRAGILLRDFGVTPDAGRNAGGTQNGCGKSLEPASAFAQATPMTKMMLAALTLVACGSSNDNTTSAPKLT